MDTIKTEYIDLPLKIQDTPYYQLDKAQDYQLPATPDEVADQFLRKLEEAYKQNPMELYKLVQVYFPKADTEKFSNTQWPKPSDLEKINQYDYNLTVQTIYKELILRKKFDKVKANEAQFLELVDDSWENYTSLLEYELTKIKFTPLLVWDILENFSYQFSQYHFRVSTLAPESIKKQWFNFQKTMEILKKLEQNIPQTQKNNPNSMEIFGYYSLIIRATLEAFFGNFEAALTIINRINYNYLINYSKAFGSYLSLFLTSSYCYFMLGEYNKAARLCELVLFFYQKNKKYFSAYMDRHLTRQYEKIVGMLAITYIFLQEKPKNAIIDILKNTAVKTKEKQYREKIWDKYNKMKQNDTNSFMKLFNYSSLPLIGQKASVDERQKQILERFENLQKITMNTIVQNYKQIPLKKLARVLKCSQEEAIKQIEEFNNISRGITPWQTTILDPLLRQRRQVKLHLDENQILKIDQESQINDVNKDLDNYKEEMSWLMDKVNLI